MKRINLGVNPFLYVSNLLYGLEFIDAILDNWSLDSIVLMDKSKFDTYMAKTKYELLYPDTTSYALVHTKVDECVELIIFTTE